MTISPNTYARQISTALELEDFAHRVESPAQWAAKALGRIAPPSLSDSQILESRTWTHEDLTDAEVMRAINKSMQDSGLAAFCA